MKVLAVIEAATVTGPARNLLEFGELAKGKVELLILTFRRGAASADDPFLSAVRESGLAVEVVGESGAGDLRPRHRIAEIAEEFGADVVQTHGVKSSLLLWMGGVHRRRAWVAWHHGYTVPTLKQRIYNHADRLCLRSARRVITVTGAFVPELERMGVRREVITVIPNAIRAEWFGEGPVARIEGVAEGSPVVLGLGRFSGEKAFHFLLEAMVEVEKVRPDAALVLVGDGPLRIQLEALQGRLGLRCHFVGQQKDVRPFYRRASVLALPSLSEGSPNVLIEAMAAGLPVVATAVGGVPETLVAGREGLLVPAGDAGALADGILLQLNDRERALAMAQAAKVRVREQMNPEVRVERILSVYRDALGRNEKNIG